MFFKILLKYLIGYINVKIEGYSIERFMNKCVNNKILFWNIKREKSTIAYMNVGMKDFETLCNFAQDTQCQIQVQHKRGLPFVLQKYKKRKIFFIIILLIILCLVVLSRFVWNIQIEGLNKIQEAEISELLNSKGLKTGTLKDKIDKQKIINEIRLERRDIAWIGISVDGTNAVVKIVEAEAKPEIINEEDYCNIVATKDAQIVKISAQTGQRSRFLLHRYQ